MPRLTIPNKILLGFIIGAVVPIFLLEMLDVRTARQELEMQQIEALDAIADLKKESIEDFFDDMAHEAMLMSDLGTVRASLPVVAEHLTDRDSDAYQEARKALDADLIPTRAHKGLLEIILANEQAEMVYNTGAVHNDSELGISVEALVGQDPFDVHPNVYVSDVFESPFAPSGFELVTAAPVYAEDGTYVGIAILAIDMGPVFELILDRTGLGETGETLLGRAEEDHALFIHPLRYDPDAALTRKAPYSNPDALPIREATQGTDGRGVTVDYRPVPIIASWRSLDLPSDHLSWGLVAKIDTSEAFAASQELLRQAIIIGVGAVLLLLLTSLYLRRSIVSPLQEVRQAASTIADGDLDARVTYKGNDEIGDLGASFNRMTEELVKSRSRLEHNLTELEDKNQEIGRASEATLNVLEDVAAEKERITTILDSIGDGVFVVDLHHTIEAINPIAAKLAGHESAQAVGKPYKDILRFEYEKDGQVNDRFITEAIRTGEIQEMSNHTVLVRKDGTKIPVADSAAPLFDSHGVVRGCVVVFRDVSKEHAIDKAKTEFVSLASHQLRTPLAAINWNLEMLQEEIHDQLDKDQRQSLEDVYHSSRRMAELVTALLNVSRIELGTFAVDPAPTDIIALTKEVVKDLEPRIKEKKLKLSEQYSSQKLVMNIDPKLMRMVIENLISNAVKYTPEKKLVEISIEEDGKKLSFSVQDEGYGIPKEQQSKIFTRLFRADNVRTKDVEGTGLGLYIAKSIVEHSGGTIWFESKEDAGSTFFFTLPLKGMQNKKGARKLT